MSVRASLASYGGCGVTVYDGRGRGAAWRRVAVGGGLWRVGIMSNPCRVFLGVKIGRVPGGGGAEFVFGPRASRGARRVMRLAAPVLFVGRAAGEATRSPRRG